MYTGLHVSVVVLLLFWIDARWLRCPGKRHDCCYVDCENTFPSQHAHSSSCSRRVKHTNADTTTCNGCCVAQLCVHQTHFYPPHRTLPHAQTATHTWLLHQPISTTCGGTSIGASIPHHMCASPIPISANLHLTAHQPTGISADTCKVTHRGHLSFALWLEAGSCVGILHKAVAPVCDDGVCEM